MTPTPVPTPTNTLAPAPTTAPCLAVDSAVIDSGDGTLIAFQVGDEAILTSTQYMVDLWTAPGSAQFSGQEVRDSLVQILRIADCGGDVWFEVDGLSLPGWVPAENMAPHGE